MDRAPVHREGLDHNLTGELIHVVRIVLAGRNPGGCFRWPTERREFCDPDDLAGRTAHVPSVPCAENAFDPDPCVVLPARLGLLGKLRGAAHPKHAVTIQRSPVKLLRQEVAGFKLAVVVTGNRDAFAVVSRRVGDERRKRNLACGGAITFDNVRCLCHILRFVDAELFCEASDRSMESFARAALDSRVVGLMQVATCDRGVNPVIRLVSNVTVALGQHPKARLREAREKRAGFSRRHLSAPRKREDFHIGERFANRFSAGIIGGTSAVVARRDVE